MGKRNAQVAILGRSGGKTSKALEREASKLRLPEPRSQAELKRDAKEFARELADEMRKECG